MPARTSRQREIDCRLPFWYGTSPAGMLDAAETSPAGDVIAKQARRLFAERVTFVDHPSFNEPVAAAEILGPLSGSDDGKLLRDQEIAASLRRSAAELQDKRLLTREQEAHLFRKMNFLKSVAARLRAAINPEKPVAADLDRVEVLLREARVILNRIIGANQGLVVSIVKKFIKPGQDYSDLISDGNMSLLRASQQFDFARGVRFSTYATWVLMHDFARSTRKEKVRQSRFITGHEDALQTVADHRSGQAPIAPRREGAREALLSTLRQLNDRERTIIVRRFGLTEDKQTLVALGQELGISKERVRQLESRALRKLRGMAEIQRLDPSNC
jgi:RNA polymerase primary sigma factor